MTKPVYIVAAKRTAIGSFMGALSSVSATKLGAAAVKGAVQQAGFDPQAIDELFFGNVVSANLGQSPASQVAYYAGLRNSTPCTIINKVCASAMKSVMLGHQTITNGDNHIVVTGGMESMSQVPHYLPNARLGVKYGSFEAIDGIVRDGLQDVYTRMMMGEAGEMCADKYQINRQAQDEFCIRSYKNALSAIEQGLFVDEIAPVELTDKKGNIIQYVTDEEPHKVLWDKIPTLKPVFRKDGTITAANASKLNDGATCLIIASEEAVKTHNLKPLARIVSFADAAREPEWFTIAPSDAMPKALKKAGLTIKDIDIVEINEAFAVVVLANMQIMGIPIEKTNILGGSISLGHPLGSSGARVIVTALTALKKVNGKYGMAAVCNGGGGASAIIIERL
ncbi:MAG: acetyl-CoA C-acyltransferase [Bacteroidia bacterium]|nr:acetyl-CoA C-acyltransferase [Bacteroidia bacterium]